MTGIAHCRCGGAKPSWAAFCATCFARLPQAMIDAMNRRQPIPGAFAAAARWLGEREREQAAKRERLTASSVP